jgi:tetratricopeptide (TPR) repeat protein
MAGAYQELKRYPEEIDACHQALGLNPNSYRALESLAWAYGELERYADAVDVICRAIKIRPDLPYLHGWLAQA